MKINKSWKLQQNPNLENASELYSEHFGSFLDGKWGLNLSLWTMKDYDLGLSTENMARDKELDTC